MLDLAGLSRRDASTDTVDAGRSRGCDQLFIRRAHPRSAKPDYRGKIVAAMVRIARASEGFLPAGLRLFALTLNIALWILLIRGAAALAALWR